MANARSPNGPVGIEECGVLGNAGKFLEKFIVSALVPSGLVRLRCCTSGERPTWTRAP